MLVIGVPLLWISLGWLLKDPAQPTLVFIEGYITLYDLSPSTKIGVTAGNISLKPMLPQDKTFGDRNYFFEYIESFDRKAFEESGGGIDSKVTIAIDSTEMHHATLQIRQMQFKKRDFIDDEKLYRLKRTNQWYAFASAIMAIVVGFTLFKLLKMIQWK